MKNLWAKRDDGVWAIRSISGVKLSSSDQSGEKYFVLGGDFQLMTSTPDGTIVDALSSMGTADFLMQQSIVPVVAWLKSDSSIRCIGTGSIISCTGYLLTAAHVLMDPFEGGYGATYDGRQFKWREDLNFGVLIPFWKPSNAMSLNKAHMFLPFEQAWNWGEWKQSPLLHEPDRWQYLTDIAICKIPEKPFGGPHQPLNLSLNPFFPGEDAYSIGYAEMPDIILDPQTGRIADPRIAMDLHVSVGNIKEVFPRNQLEMNVPTPGPCFDFNARIPGKMSGAPIFGARGAVIRGVVSRSFSGEDHAYGSMLGPAMHLSLDDPTTTGRTLAELLKSGNEGMTVVVGSGL
ncbi:MAG: trypsin-like peptidase domain-containing protein [Gemmobacter sp.]